ncbi:MAG: Excinuclease ABC, C subunit [Parcubacteria group bacterium GW2011_GWC1_45_9]|nr:MAG: Excinuclease ABC, C subunit [Parcubacteria group bacterium GW2011_GWB1_45_10]KKU17389.1 MAG: Excinuclease ABC, C subunit [Parcubacteria group bacterium GW2011_GWC1_45_9]HCI05365.1 hypothetical protein [Patescibacteria group bacterium]
MILAFPEKPGAAFDAVKKIPETTGVYLFLDKNKKPLYIGKAVNLKKRIQGHNKESFLKKTRFLKIEKTSSEIEALIKESELIKKFQPKYNVVFKDGKNYFYLNFSRGSMPKIFITHRAKGRSIGPFVDGRSLKKSLNLVRRFFPFCSCQTPHLRRCLNSQMNRCFGFCCLKNYEPKSFELKKYQENVKKIKQIFTGKNLDLRKKITKKIKQAAKKLDFDTAQNLKLQLLGLENIFSHKELVLEKQNFEIEELTKFLGLKKLGRIEFFDSSQMQGSWRVAAMTVWQNNDFDKSAWRLFKIKNEKARDDLAMLEEVLKRRLKHRDWPMPQVLIVDGGKNQLKTARNTIQDSRIKILALQKNKKHAPEELLILQSNRKTAKVINLTSLSKPLKNFLEDFSEKTHSFAVRFHRKRRDRILL